MQWTKKKITPPKRKPARKANSSLFSVPFIGAVIHTPETKKALASTDNSTLFIRDKIISFAKKLGFEPLNYGDNKPDYIDDNLWSKIVIANQKSYYVDYNYAIAFYWLKSLPEYQSYTKSRLIRDIILS